jgi:hypothetical protein
MWVDGSVGFGIWQVGARHPVCVRVSAANYLVFIFLQLHWLLVVRLLCALLACGSSAVCITCLWFVCCVHYLLVAPLLCVAVSGLDRGLPSDMFAGILESPTTLSDLG